MASPDPSVTRTSDPGAPAALSDRVLARLDEAHRRRSQREARRLGVAMLLLGVGLGLVLIAAIPFRGPGVGTRVTVSWAARAVVALNILGRHEDALLAGLRLDVLPVGVTLLVLLCCLAGVWRLVVPDHRAGGHLRRRTFVAFFALTTVALGLALLTPLRAWQSGALRWGDTDVTGRVTGTLLVAGGSATVVGDLDGGLCVIGGNVTVDGVVRGDVATVMGSVAVRPGARVQGDVVAVGGQVDRAERSDVSGDIIGSAPVLSRPARSIAARVRLAIAAWVGLLMLGTTLSALFPWPMLLVAATARRFSWQSLLTALGAGIGLLLVIVPLALSVAGLPIALALALATLLAWAFGLVAVGVGCGRLILRPLGYANSTLLAAVCGLGVLGALAAIPIAGPLLIVAAGVLGAGAAVISVFDTEGIGIALALPRSR